MNGHEHVGGADLLLMIDRELPESRLEVIDAHLALCASCRQRLADFREVDAGVDGLAVDGRAEVSPMPQFARVRLSGAMRSAHAEPVPWWIRAGHVIGAPAPLVPVTAVVALAVLVLLAVVPRERSGARGATPLPDASLTPGVVSSLTAAELCDGVRPSRTVTVASRDAVLRSYQMEQVSADLFELDALVTPELGGTTDPGNLWPQRYAAPVWNASVKDQLEQLLPDLVCSQQLTLADAQREIATDWIAAYKKFFRTDVPLARTARTAPDEDELVFEGATSGWRSPGRPRHTLSRMRLAPPRVGQSLTSFAFASASVAASAGASARSASFNSM